MGCRTPPQLYAGGVGRKQQNSDEVPTSQPVQLAPPVHHSEDTVDSGTESHDDTWKKNPAPGKLSTDNVSAAGSCALTVISANIGLSAVKSSMLSDVCKERHCHCLCLQETHRGTRKARPRIPGMTPVAERHHDKYGSAIYIRDDLKVKSISVTAAKHVEAITAEQPDVDVHSVY